MTDNEWNEKLLEEYDRTAIAFDDVLVMSFVSEVRRLNALLDAAEGFVFRGPGGSFYVSKDTSFDSGWVIWEHMVGNSLSFKTREEAITEAQRRASQIPICSACQHPWSEHTIEEGCLDLVHGEASDGDPVVRYCGCRARKE